MSNLHEERFVGIEATQALIAKVKKGFSELEDKISERSVFDADFDNDELVITKRA